MSVSDIIFEKVLFFVFFSNSARKSAGKCVYFTFWHKKCTVFVSRDLLIFLSPKHPVLKRVWNQNISFWRCVKSNYCFKINAFPRHFPFFSFGQSRSFFSSDLAHLLRFSVTRIMRFQNGRNVVENCKSRFKMAEILCKAEKLEIKCSKRLLNLENLADFHFGFYQVICRSKNEQIEPEMCLILFKIRHKIGKKTGKK